MGKKSSKTNNSVNEKNVINNIIEEEDVIEEKPFRSLNEIEFRSQTQEIYWNTIQNKEITLCSGPAGTGKAQPMNSMVLTPKGWEKIGDLNENDIIVTPDGKLSKIIEIHDFNNDMDIYEIEFSDGRTAQCTKNHLWKIYNYDWTYKWKVISTENIITYLNKKRNVRLYIPLINLKENIIDIDLPIDPYLLGVLIGDGGLTYVMPTITNIDDEIINKTSNKLKEYNCKLSTLSGNSYGIVMENTKISGKLNKILHPIRKKLMELNLFGIKSEYKFIPPIYFNASISQKIELIKGLMDTDGYVDRCGSLTYSTSSLKLAQDLMKIIHSIGGISYISTKKCGYKDKSGKYIKCLDGYIVHIKYKDPKQLVGLSRKKERISNTYQYSDLKLEIKKITYLKKDKCRCITIDNNEQLYITNDFIVTHNSFISLAKALQLKIKNRKTYKKIIIIKPVVEAEEKLGYLPGSIEEKLEPYVFSSKYILSKLLGPQQTKNMFNKGTIEVMALAYTRGMNIDNSIVIVEEAQNMTKNAMKTLLTRIGENSKFIISGDIEQSDKFKNGKDSGLYFAIQKLKNIPEIGIVEFKSEDIIRNPLIGKILKEFNGDVE